MNPIGKTYSSQVLKIEEKNAYEPFEVIKKVASNSFLWNRLLEAANREITFSATPSSEIQTSCLVNFYALTMIFLGEQITKEISVPLQRRFRYIINGQHSDLLIHNIFSGFEMIAIKEKYVKDPMYSYYRELFLINTETSTSQKLKEAVGRIINEMNDLYSQNFISSLCEGNRFVIESLENDMANNSAEVTSQKSFTYHILIGTPPLKTMLDGTIEELLSSPSSVYHAFILEQYYSEERQEIFTRLYQTWVGKYDILQSFANLQYENKDEGCFTDCELKEFFVNLKGLLLCGSNPFEDLTKIDEYQNACFGVQEKMMSAIFPRRKEGFFTGLSIRYISWTINPNNCSHNLNDLIQKYANS